MEKLFLMAVIGVLVVLVVKAFAKSKTPKNSSKIGSGGTGYVDNTSDRDAIQRPSRD